MQRLFSGELFLLFCRKSPKYQNNGVFKFPCTIGFYMYTGSLQVQQTLETFLKITFASLGLMKIMLSRMFDMQY